MDDGGTETEQFEASEISEVVEALDHPVEAVITNGEEAAEATNVHREAEAGTSEGAMVEMDIGDGDGTVCMVDENGVLQKVTGQKCKLQLFHLQFKVFTFIILSTTFSKGLLFTRYIKFCTIS